MRKYVSASDVIQGFVNHKDFNSEMDKVLLEVMDAIPTADIQPVIHAHWCDDMGVWIEGERCMGRGQMIDMFYCSWCGYHMYYKTPYCANCGAKMDEEVE